MSDKLCQNWAKFFAVHKNIVWDFLRFFRKKLDIEIRRQNFSNITEWKIIIFSLDESFVEIEQKIIVKQTKIISWMIW